MALFMAEKMWLLLLMMWSLQLLVTAAPSAKEVNSGQSNVMKHSAEYERHVQDILQQATLQMQKIWARKRDMFLTLTAKGRAYNIVNQAPLKHEIENEYYHLVHELAANLSVIPVEELSDPLLRRRVQRFAKLQLYGLGKEDFQQAKDLLHTMQTFLTSHSVCHIHHTDCQQTVAMLPNIQIYTIRAKRREELDYYWLKWREAINEKQAAKSSFIDYVRLLRLAATYNGHVTASRTWFLYFDSENFQRELEDVVWEIMPLYRELHAYLRNAARLAYGLKLTPSDGAIPAPVLDQMQAQAWFPRSAFRTPYPKSQLPSVHQRLEAVLVTPVEINKKAVDFFESLGLKHMSDGWYDKYARRLNEEEYGPDCKSEVFYFPPEAALRYCPKMDYKKMIQMHGTMAELQYNFYKRMLPFGLDREPCPGFGSALGEAAVIASGTPRHLFRLHIMDNQSLTEEQSLNRLFRMGIHTLLSVPQYFINDKYLVDVMDGRIGVEEYNCAYWRLQYKYAGAEPPNIRNEKHFDPDFRFYRGLQPEKSNTIKFISEILGYQFYRAFCLASGQYKPGDPEYPLHNCDYYGSKNAGDMLKGMMELGATKHWRDVMEIATGERKLSGRGVMEYFAPLFTWLKEQNKQLGLEPGWDADIKCRND